MENPSVLIALIVVAGIVIIAYLLRNRITEILAQGSVTKREGKFRVKAASPRTERGPASDEHYSVDVSGNTVIGWGIIRVLHDGVRVARNLFAGKAEVEVKGPEKKSR